MASYEKIGLIRTELVSLYPQLAAALSYWFVFLVLDSIESLQSLVQPRMKKLPQPLRKNVPIDLLPRSTLLLDGADYGDYGNQAEERETLIEQTRP